MFRQWVEWVLLNTICSATSSNVHYTFKCPRTNACSRVTRENSAGGRATIRGNRRINSLLHRAAEIKADAAALITERITYVLQIGKFPFPMLCSLLSNPFPSPIPHTLSSPLFSSSHLWCSQQLNTVICCFLSVSNVVRCCKYVNYSNTNTFLLRFLIIFTAKKLILNQ